MSERSFTGGVESADGSQYSSEVVSNVSIQQNDSFFKKNQNYILIGSVVLIAVAGYYCYQKYFCKSNTKMNAKMVNFKNQTEGGGKEKHDVVETDPYFTPLPKIVKETS